MKRFLLRSFDEMFVCNNPKKFYNNLKQVTGDEHIQRLLAEFFQKHYLAYLYHLDMKLTKPELEFTGDPNLIEYAENMTLSFKEWLPESLFNRIVKNTERIFKVVNDQLTKNEEE